MKKLTLLLAAVALSTTVATAKTTNYQYQQAQPQQTMPSYYYPQQSMNYTGNEPLKGRVVFVPAGVDVPAVTTMTLSSENLTLGQTVSMALGHDFYYNNSLIAPAGSYVTGTVIDVAKAGHATKNARLQIRFTQLTTPYGVNIPISAVIKTDDGSGMLRGGTAMDTTKEYAKDMGVGAGAGALTGLVASAIAGGAIGKGTAIMTGVGAGVGLAKSLWDKGGAIEIPANSTVDLLLLQPITVNPNTRGY